MSEAQQRRALVADLARRLQLASHDELRVLDRLFTRLELGRDRYGALHLAADRRDWRREFADELLDAVVYDTVDAISGEDRQRAELRDAARREIDGSGEELAIPVEPRREAEFAAYAHLTTISDEPARIAERISDEERPYAALEVGGHRE